LQLLAIGFGFPRLAPERPDPELLVSVAVTRHPIICPSQSSGLRFPFDWRPLGLLGITPASLGRTLGVSWWPMAKVDIDIVQKILKESGVDVRVAAEILNQIRDAVAEEAVEREKPAKKQMLVLVSEPEEGLPKDLTGWVVQLLEDDDPKEVATKIVDVAKAFNESPKGQRVPVESFGDAVQSISGKLFKESDLWIKTREPVRIIPVKNSIGRRRRD